MRDIERIVSGALERYDMFCYSINFEDMVDAVAEKLFDRWRSAGWCRKNDLPHFDENDMLELTKEFELITDQQYEGKVAYLEHVKEMEDEDCEPFDFWEFYMQWCLENGLYNDRASYQKGRDYEFNS